MTLLEPREIERAVDLQRRAYRLLGWMEGAMEKGFIAPHTAHVYASLAASALAWMDEHYLNLPADGRPEREDLPAFANLFATYLDSTFDLEANPGQRLYSPQAHCFCPMCSWMVRVPHLRPKRIGRAERRRARGLERDALRALADRLGARVPDDRLEALLDDPALREPRALLAYAVNLLQRLEGISVGPATLALWRGFAWTAKGSPRKGFRLEAAAILEAQDGLARRLVGQGEGGGG